jgi:hypothetical protein
MVSDLRAHGVRAEGQAVRDFRKSDNEAQVRFPVRDEVQVRTLQIQDTVPQTPKQGDTLAIVYDANDPSRVLLVSQLTDQHRVFNYGAAALGGVFVIFGGLWWRRSSRPVRLPTLPSTDLRVGPDGKLPRERRRR